MKLTEILTRWGIIGLIGLAGCCNTDKIKEEGIKDFFRMNVSTNEDEKEYTLHKKEIDKYIKSFIQITKEYPNKFIFDYEKINEEIKGTPFESPYNRFLENNSKYESNCFCNEKKIREEAVKEYIKLSIEGIKKLDELFFPFGKDVRFYHSNKASRIKSHDIHQE